MNKMTTIEKSSLFFGICCLAMLLLCIVLSLFISTDYLPVPITFGVVFGYLGYTFGIDYKNTK